MNAHVLVLKYSSDFREYRKIMDRVAKVPGVTGVAPFVINPMMVTHGDRTATGVREALPDTGKPPSSPVAALATPRAPISWSPSTV